MVVETESSRRRVRSIVSHCKADVTLKRLLLYRSSFIVLWCSLVAPVAGQGLHSSDSGRPHTSQWSTGPAARRPSHVIVIPHILQQHDSQEMQGLLCSLPWTIFCCWPGWGPGESLSHEPDWRTEGVNERLSSGRCRGREDCYYSDKLETDGTGEAGLQSEINWEGITWRSQHLCPDKYDKSTFQPEGGDDSHKMRGESLCNSWLQCNIRRNERAAQPSETKMYI